MIYWSRCDSRMWVVKLGGSLAFSDHLPVWLDRLAGRSDLVVVPGGGPFADQVRILQGRWGFADSAAHHMALLGMEQFGRMLCGLRSGLSPAASLFQIFQLAGEGVTPVWLPVAMVRDDPSIAESWEVTSDSLAAWLCGQLGAEDLLLIKSGNFATEPSSTRELADEGIVDWAFPAYVEAVGVSVHLLGASDAERLDALVQGRNVAAPAV